MSRDSNQIAHTIPADTRDLQSRLAILKQQLQGVTSKEIEQGKQAEAKMSHLIEAAMAGQITMDEEYKQTNRNLMEMAKTYFNYIEAAYLTQTLRKNLIKITCRYVALPTRKFPVPYGFQAHHRVMEEMPDAIYSDEPLERRDLPASYVLHDLQLQTVL